MADANSRSQGFRHRTSPVIQIQAHEDGWTGKYYVLWTDIERVFPGVKHVRSGLIVVSFARDDHGNVIKPERIKYVHGVVLDIILDNTELAHPNYPPPDYNTIDQAPRQGADSETETNKGFPWRNVAFYTGMAVAGAVAAPVAVVGGVAALGFGAGGIVAGTPAAAIMASYGGTVAAGSACAILQSIGAAGLGFAGSAMASMTGAAVVGGAAAAGKSAYDAKHKG
ncbi:hypothetical protein B0O80DRAFT_444859 [Mortierella sp. GBAus27b]|nr:hypothetical protein BGX31_001210 [Mortierella sp. GBA43]KAI8357418.1 hypothetical protein B0O80DRAFT_444859 [Mortierella sp. GBAus27b]